MNTWLNTYLNFRNTDERKAMCYLFQMRLIKNIELHISRQVDLQVSVMLATVFV